MWTSGATAQEQDENEAFLIWACADSWNPKVCGSDHFSSDHCQALAGIRLPVFNCGLRIFYLDKILKNHCKANNLVSGQEL